MKAFKSCEIACTTNLKKPNAEAFIKAIDEDYRVHWIVDNLPVGVITGSEDSQRLERGFPVGFTEMVGNTKKRYINNHIRIIIDYHDGIPEVGTVADTSPPVYQVVGFRVEPMSIHHTSNDAKIVKGISQLSSCGATKQTMVERKNYQEVKSGETIVFTYDVQWVKSQVEWGNRWDAYILQGSPDAKVHWFSITTSIMIAFFLTVLIALILIRALRKDISAYNESVVDDSKEETGWKMVHGDVFRPPSTFPMLLRYHHSTI